MSNANEIKFQLEKLVSDLEKLEEALEKVENKIEENVQRLLQVGVFHLCGFDLILWLHQPGYHNLEIILIVC